MKKPFIFNKVLLGGFLAFFFLNILNTAYSNVLALIKEELTLSYTFSGALMSSYFIGYTIGQIPWGYLADRWGSRRTITLSVIGIASSSVVFGLTFNFWQAIASRFLSGLLGAGIFVPGVRLISSWFSPLERGTALGFLSVGGSTGLIFASWTIPLITIHIGWRGSILIFGLIAIFSTVIIWSTLRDRKLQDSESSTRSDKDVTEIIRSRNFWILALTQFLRLGSNYAFIAWLPLLLYEEYKLNIFSASLAFSIFNFAGMLSNPVGGFVSDRVGEKRILVLSFLILALDLALFMNSKSFPLIFITVFFLGWFINFIRSPSYTLIPKLYGVNVAGKISGIHNTFASLGALAIPLFLGYIRDITFSYYTGWIALLTLLTLGTAINVLLNT